MFKSSWIKLKDYVIYHWTVFIVILAVMAFVINIIIFFPGYMSNDSVLMYYVARGAIPTDLAPVMLGLIWRVLYRLTGSTASILFFQLAMLWTSLCLLAVYIYKRSSSKLFSLLCLSVGILPFVFNLSGVIWRDSHMTFALILATSLLLFLNKIKSKKWHAVSFVVIILLILYASVSRYNAIIATVPMFFLAIRMSGYVKKTWCQIFITVISIPLVVFVLFPSINFTMGATKSNNQPGIMLDDIIMVSKIDNLKKIDMPQELLQDLLTIKGCSMAKDVLVDNIDFCADNNIRSVLYANHGQFQRIWLSVITSDPLGYAYYKAKMFFHVLLPINSYSYIWQDGIVSNKYNETVKFPALESVGSGYLQLSSRYLRATFEPWFWLLAGLAILFLSIVKRREHRLVINILCISATLYIFGYIPTGATPDYRYIYWSVLAVIFAFILYLLDKYKIKHTNVK